MKKIIVCFLTCFLLLSLSGCRGKEKPLDKTHVSSTEITEPTQAAEIVTVPDTPSSPVPSSSSFSEEDVKQVILTFPSEFMKHQDTDTVIEAVEETGSGEVQQHQDGSMTLSIQEDKYDNLLDKMSDEIEDSIQEMTSGGDFPYIKKVEYSADFSQMTVTINPFEYAGSLKDLKSMKLALSAMMYQALSGIECEDAKVVVHLVDEMTGKDLGSIVYPDIL